MQEVREGNAMKDLFLEMGGTPMIVTVSDGSGEAIVKGRKWHWEHHNYCGPVWINKDGTDRKRQPGEHHPVWKAYNRWLNRRERGAK